MLLYTVKSSKVFQEVIKGVSEYDFKACKNLCKYTWIKEDDQGYILKREKKREILKSPFITSLSCLE